MTAREFLERLDLLLGEERLAIQRLDGAAVARIANEKEEILEGLKERSQEILAENLSSQVNDTLAGLRRNGILLAHARACLRDMVTAIRSETDGRLSLRG